MNDRKFCDAIVESNCEPISADRVDRILSKFRANRVTDTDMIRGLAWTLAETAKATYRLSGCFRQDVIDAVASGAMAGGLQLYMPDRRCLSLLSEGKKDGAPLLAEGVEFGTIDDQVPRILVLTDPCECTGELARSASSRRRSSMALMTLAPDGSVPITNSESRALKIAVPPGTPVGDGGIKLDSPPSSIVRILTRHFNCPADRITVAMLERPWNKVAMEEFEAAGARIKRIMAGDFEEHIRAARAVSPGGPIHISYGIGGLPEGIIAVPYMRFTGAELLLMPVPIGLERSVHENGQPHFDTSTMITSKDCLLGIAGISDAGYPGIVPGARYCQESNTLHVTVLVASPLLKTCRRFEASFNRDTGSWLAETEATEWDFSEPNRLYHNVGLIHDVDPEWDYGQYEQNWCADPYV